MAEKMHVYVDKPEFQVRRKADNRYRFYLGYGPSAALELPTAWIPGMLREVRDAFGTNRPATIAGDWLPGIGGQPKVSVKHDDLRELESSLELIWEQVLEERKGTK